MKKLIALVLILVLTNLMIQSKDPLTLSNRVIIENAENPKDHLWEYVKDRLFDGKTDYVYKINPLMDEGPILLELNRATKLDSLAVKEIMEEIRVLLPLKTVAYLDDFAGEKISNTSKYKNDREKYIGDIPYYRLRYSVVSLSFSIADRSTIGNKVNTVLLDDSRIERSNNIREDGSVREPNSVWFFFNDSISYENRKSYIQYEFLRTLCFIQPNNLNAYAYDDKGVFYSPDYVPQNAKFNKEDKFLLQKLYSENFKEQFKDYMFTNYPWRYASNFLHKNLTKAKAIIIILAIGILVFILLFGYFQNKKFKYSFLNYFYPIVLIMLNLANFTLIYGYITDINYTIMWKESLVAIIMSTAIAVITSLVLWLFDILIEKQKLNFTLQLALKVVFTFVAFNSIIVLVIVSGAKVNFQDYQLQKTYAPALFLWTALALGRGFLIYLNHISASLVKQKDVELSHLKEINAQSELKLLQSHINPHFLYNALNSIAGLAHDDADKTEKMALSLSDLFRYSINKKGEKMSTVSEEVNLVENYLEIEKIRFGERLVFTLTIDDAVKEEKIPMFILQPLIENAIKHGISKIGGEAKISLDIKSEGEGLLITVSDNGPAFPKGLVSGHGLQTVYDLLRLSYGENASLQWENSPKKQIVITIQNKQNE